MAQAQASRPTLAREEALGTITGPLASGRLPSIVLIEGEAGIGKTTLWREALRVAAERGFRILSSVPRSDETSLSHGGLADLLGPVLGESLGALPPPQKQALEVVLRIREPGAQPPDQLALAIAFRTLIGVLAVDAPLLLVVDDWLWLDRASAETIVHAARRLSDDTPVGLLIARRIGAAPRAAEGWPAARVTRFEVPPLSVGSFGSLLRHEIDPDMPRPLIVRIHDASRGNPLFGMEIARALAQDGRRLGPDDPLPVSESLGELLGARLARLPQRTISVLEATALEHDPTVTTLSTALGFDAHAPLARARAAGIVELHQDLVRFTHPLLAEATANRMSRERRAQVHRLLAAVAGEPEQRAHHLAEGLLEADEGAAGTIEQVARGLLARGAPAAAADLFEHAARLTPLPDAQARTHRLIDASRAWHGALDWVRARTSAEQAVESAPAGRTRALAIVQLAECSPEPGALADRFEAEAGAASELAARFWLVVSGREIDVDLDRALANARVALGHAEQTGDPTLTCQILGTLGVIEMLLCLDSARATLERAVELEARATPMPMSTSPTLSLAELAIAHDDPELARPLLRGLLDKARTSGRLLDEAYAAWKLGYIEWRAGDWNVAEQHLERAMDLMAGSGEDRMADAVIIAAALLSAARGDEQRTADLVRAAEAIQSNQAIARWQSQTVRRLLDLAHERFDQAASGDDERPSRWLEPGLNLPRPNLIEALIGAGRLEEAEPMLDEWEALGRRVDRARALATAFRARGLLLAARGDLSAAEASLDAALAEHARFPSRFELARTLLALGTVRRRLKHRAAAREALESAIAIFDDLRAVPWAERARRELARIPGRRTHAELTEAELRVAALVAEGRSNREVAAALFVSPRTVEEALTSVYAKLGVRSRTELARRFPAVAGDLTLDRAAPDLRQGGPAQGDR